MCQIQILCKCVSLFSHHKLTRPSNRLMHILPTRATWFSCGNVYAGQGVGPFFSHPEAMSPPYQSSSPPWSVSTSLQAVYKPVEQVKRRWQKIIIQRWILPPPLFHNWCLFCRHSYLIYAGLFFERSQREGQFIKIWAIYLPPLKLQMNWILHQFHVDL